MHDPIHSFLTSLSERNGWEKFKEKRGRENEDIARRNARKQAAKESSVVASAVAGSSSEGSRGGSSRRPESLSRPNSRERFSQQNTLTEVLAQPPEELGDDPDQRNMPQPSPENAIPRASSLESLQTSPRIIGLVPGLAGASSRQGVSGMHAKGERSISTLGRSLGNMNRTIIQGMRTRTPSPVDRRLLSPAAANARRLSRRGR